MVRYRPILGISSEIPQIGQGGQIMGIALNKGETAFTVAFGAEAQETFMAGKWDFCYIWDNSGYTGMGQAECRDLDESGEIVAIRMDADKSCMKDKVPNWFIVDKSTQTIYFRLESDKFGQVRIAPFCYGQDGNDRGVLNVDLVESDILDISDGKTISDITDYLDETFMNGENGRNRAISGNWLNIR
jgi:hypothetical protein